MIDAEKVDKGLEACTTGAIGCKGCPYWNSGGSCVSDLMRDAAELIRQLKNGRETPATMEV